MKRHLRISLKELLVDLATMSGGGHPEDIPTDAHIRVECSGVRLVKLDDGDKRLVAKRPRIVIDWDDGKAPP